MPKKKIFDFWRGIYRRREGILLEDRVVRLDEEIVPLNGRCDFKVYEETALRLDKLERVSG
jgi:hypothetical protein